MKTYQTAIFLASIYLLVYTLLFAAGAPLQLMVLLYCGSPIPVLWMAYQILHNAGYHGRTLEEGEEYGYADRSNPSTIG
jgi:4-hydroxybenzoate polyprenyltransferase